MITRLTSSIARNKGCKRTRFLMAAFFWRGTLLGISNVIASIPGIALPAMLGELLKEQSPLEAWALFYYIGSAIGIITALEFILLGSAELQSWGVDNKFKVIAKYGTSQGCQLGAEQIEDANHLPPAS